MNIRKAALDDEARADFLQEELGIFAEIIALGARTGEFSVDALVPGRVARVRPLVGVQVGGIVDGPVRRRADVPVDGPVPDRAVDVSNVPVARGSEPGCAPAHVQKMRLDETVQVLAAQMLLRAASRSPPSCPTPRAHTAGRGSSSPQ